MSNAGFGLLQVRLFVALCFTYAHACVRRFLTTSPNFDVRRWAADGLAYLTLDADVKEDLVDNVPALKSLFSLCQCDDAHVLYSITTIFVNLTNTYNTRKQDKQMEELAAYAKQHVPKEHTKVGHASSYGCSHFESSNVGCDRVFRRTSSKAR